MRHPLALICFLPAFGVFGQLPNGSTAPDFTLTDYYGTSHNLYSYLNSGKTVFLEFFAAHCPSCWSYHQTNRLKNMYNQYGPSATDEIMVLALEHDQWNDSNAFIGNGPAWVTQGNWLTGTPYPIFNVEDPDRGVFTDYMMTFYPLIYRICPDGILERVFTSQTEAQLYQMVQDCQAAQFIEELDGLGDIRFDPLARSLLIERCELVQRLEVLDLQGRAVQQVEGLSQCSVVLDPLPTGVYLFRLQTDNGPVVRRFLVER